MFLPVSRIVYGPAVFALLLTMIVTAAPLESDPAFRAAQARYDDFEFADARERFEAILKRKLDDKTRARVLVWVGMCDAEDGALSDAAAAFDEAATYDPEVKPLPTMSPKARRMLDEARVRARTGPATGSRDQTTRGDGVEDAPPDGEPGAAGGAEPSPSSAPSALVVGGGVGLGVAVLGAVGGAFAGSLATNAADEAAALDDAAAATRRYGEATGLATTATVAFGAGAVAGVVGVVCLAIGLLGGQEPPR
jgi:pyruvate/2-oxoglutarate dehydrogenase complex dihydrolipoamide acyltransferase (E2) component